MAAAESRGGRAFARLAEGEDEDDEESEEAHEGRTGIRVYTSSRGVKYYDFSCLCFDANRFPRRHVIDLIDYGASSPEHPSWFDVVVMVIIGVNAIYIMHFDPLHATAVDPKCLPELFFNTAFTLELVLRAHAQGLVITRNSFLSDAFGWLDLVIVVGGWLPWLFASYALRPPVARPKINRGADVPLARVGGGLRAGPRRWA